MKSNSFKNQTTHSIPWALAVESTKCTMYWTDTRLNLNFQYTSINRAKSSDTK